MASNNPLGLPDALLNLRFGERSVGEHLAAALERGDLLLTPQGRLTLPARAGSLSPSLYSQNGARLDRPSCAFLGLVLYDGAYGQTTVPWNCRACHKVKACPTTVKGLLALRRLSRAIPCPAKFRPENHYLYAQVPYAGYFYCRDQAHAQEVYQQLRPAVDQDPDLGPEVAVYIKRACSRYEAQCGPAGQWTFDPRQQDLEQALLAVFTPPARRDRLLEFEVLMRWMQAAQELGDDTYLDYTGGRRLTSP